MSVVANRRSPCFCNVNCPGIFTPFLNYRFKAPLSVFPAYQTFKLLKFQTTGPGGECFWLPAEPEPFTPPIVFVQDLRKVAAPFGDYAWIMLLQELPNSETYLLHVTVSIPEEDVVSHVSPACNTFVMTLEDIVTGNEATLEAVPEWMCTDAQAVAWPAS